MVAHVSARCASAREHTARWRSVDGVVHGYHRAEDGGGRADAGKLVQPFAGFGDWAADQIRAGTLQPDGPLPAHAAVP
jgi:hypothetical protein